MNQRFAKRGKTPKNKTYRKKDFLTWLNRNSETNPVDVAWLLKEEMAFYNSLIGADAARAKAAATVSGCWTTKEPFLRLYCCMTTDRAKKALRRKDDTKS
jgi:hypothetical protein